MILVVKSKKIRRKLFLHLRQRLNCVLSVFFFMLISGCDYGPEIIEISGKKFGTTYRLTIVADQPAPADLSEMIESELNEIDVSMSTYKSSSEINQFNRLNTNIPFNISEHFASVIEISENIWLESGGAFEPTIGPLVDLWGFGPDVKSDKVPSESDISSAIDAVGFDAISIKVAVTGTTLSKSRPVRLDLSAVAKGYAVDVLANLLESYALPDYLIEIGGETRVSGYNPQGKPWRLAIESPGVNGGVAHIVSMTDGAVATSGDYRNYFELDGKRYSHTIDPKSGYPITHNLTSVSVIADSCAEADAWATAMMVLGDEKGLELANALDLAVYMVLKEGQTLKSSNSKAFEAYKGPNSEIPSAKEI